jgi:hypothetical protein
MNLSSKLFLLLLAAVLGGCGGGNSSDGSENQNPNADVAPITSGSWFTPPPGTSWQWQLSGTVNTGYNVDIYDIDLFDSSESLIQQLKTAGRRVICYFSAGSFEAWRADSAAFAATDKGNTIDGWADERWLDIRSENVHNIINSRLDLALQKGCDGVEPDNMDGYLNDSGFNLNASDQLAFNRLVANEAHIRGLSVGLKNDLDQIRDLIDYFDFAVNEQCFEFSECDTLASFTQAGKAVLSAEYKQAYVNDQNTRNTLCNEAQRLQFSTLVLPLDLDDAFRYSCL